jgi:hypothetical protein
MTMKVRAALALVAIAVAVLAIAAAGSTVADKLTEVFVLNFPDPQTVKGRVEIEGPIRNAELVQFPAITVSPVRPTDTTRLINAGTLVTDGWEYAVLSLVGSTRGETLHPGAVGAILIPDEDPITRAFFEDGDVLLSLQLEAQPEPGPPTFFASDASRQTIAFPRYQILLYNTTDKSVTVTLFAYLTSG